MTTDTSLCALVDDTDEEDPSAPSKQPNTLTAPAGGRPVSGKPTKKHRGSSKKTSTPMIPGGGDSMLASAFAKTMHSLPSMLGSQRLGGITAQTAVAPTVQVHSPACAAVCTRASACMCTCA
jgi:hypothetical protein